MSGFSEADAQSATEGLLRRLRGLWWGCPTIELLDAMPSTDDFGTAYLEIERLLRASGQVLERRYRSDREDGMVLMSCWKLKDWQSWPQSEEEAEYWSDAGDEDADPAWDGDWFVPST